MEQIKCKCGKASMTYVCIGEDLFSGITVNTTIVKEGYGKVCICKSCGAKYDNFDPCMVLLWTALDDVIRTEIANYLEWYYTHLLPLNHSPKTIEMYFKSQQK